MNPTTLISACGLLLLVSAPLRAQSDSAILFRGAPGGFGPLESRDLGAPGPPSFPLGTQPLRLLPIEVNGRTDLARHDPLSAWRHDDVPGASRIRLPLDGGSLYHHELDVGGGAREFGFFLVDAGGQARLLLQLAGSGAAADQNPLLGRVGISRDGTRLLCATSVAAGGNLLEVDLQSAAVIDRTPLQPPLDWRAQSLFLAPSWGLAVHAAGVLRFPRSAAGASAAIDFGAGGPTWFSGEVAFSALGDHAATVAGSAAQLADVYVISAQGAVARATPLPARISRAGYLPEELDGPYLAVSNDGALVAWRTERNTREAFLARVPWQSAATASQLTNDNNFIDTIDEVGQFAFRSDTLLGFTAGERAGLAGGVDKIDVFSASLGAGAATPTLQNLSLSSGIASPPFLLPGRIQPEGAVDLPGGVGRLLQDGDSERLVLLLPQGGTPLPILAQVKAFDDSVRSGDQWLLALRRSSGSQPRQVVRWSPSAALSPQILFSDDNTDVIAHLTLRGNIGAFVDEQVNAERLYGVDLSGGPLQLFSPRKFHYGSATSISAGGELVTALGDPALNVVFARWVPASLPKRLLQAAGPGFVLPGL